MSNHIYYLFLKTYKNNVYKRNEEYEILEGN